MVYIGLCTRLSRSHYGYLLLSIHNEMEVLCLLPLNFPRNLYFYSWGNRGSKPLGESPLSLKTSKLQSRNQNSNSRFSNHLWPILQCKGNSSLFLFKLWNIWNLAYLYHYWVLLTVSYEKVLWELHCKECRMPGNWRLQTVLLEITPESPLDSKEIEPVNLKREINPEYSLEGLMLNLKL